MACAHVRVQNEIRPNDLRVVHAHAAICIQIVGVEETPPRRPCCDFAAPLIRVPVLEREIEAVVCTRPPIDADDVVHLRILGVLLGRVVELPLREPAVEIGALRKHPQQREPVLVDAVGRNDVAGEAPWPARDGVAGPFAERILDVDESSLRIERLREISLQLPRGRHRPIAQRSRAADERSLQ